MSRIRTQCVYFSVGLLLAVAISASAKYYYVSGTGLDSRDGSTEELAFRNLSKAAGLVNPGDTVWILNGTYSALTINRSGNAQGWIVWKRKSGATPEIKSNGWNAINITASYHVIDGLILTGNNDSVTLAEAEADYGAAGYGDGFYNGNGISIDGRNVTDKYHHLIIRHCIVRKFCGGGINAIESDHVTIEDNQVHENAWYSRYGCSGISILSSINVDQDSGYHMVVRRNRVWNNRGLVKWKQIDKYSDGNGIIIDSDKDHGFTGKTLVCNNVSFNNGGSGIHSYKSQNVDIINNTTCFNGQKVNYSNCYAGSSTNVRLLNNIIYAEAGKPTNSNYQNTNVEYDYNIYYGGLAPAVTGAHDRVINPGLVNPSKDPAVADFRLTATSDAIDKGTTFGAVSSDILGVARPQGSACDIGAYEFPAGTGAKSIPQRSMLAQAPRPLLYVSVKTGRAPGVPGIVVNAKGRGIDCIAKGSSPGAYLLKP